MDQTEQLRRAAQRYPDAFENVYIAHVIEEIQDIAVSARQTVQGKLINGMHLLILLKFEAVADAGEVRSNILHALHDAQDVYLPSMDAFLNLQSSARSRTARTLRRSASFSTCAGILGCGSTSSTDLRPPRHDCPAEAHSKETQNLFNRNT